MQTTTKQHEQQKKPHKHHKNTQLALPKQVRDPGLVVDVPAGHLVHVVLDSVILVYPIGHLMQPLKAYLYPRGHLTIHKKRKNINQKMNKYKTNKNNKPRRLVCLYQIALNNCKLSYD